MFKPKNYNSLSAYLIVDQADDLVKQLTTIFEAVELRRFMHENGKIAHLELKIDDTVLMISNSTEQFPATQTTLHLYVADAFETFNLAIANGCTLIEKPTSRPNDPDLRGSFLDLSGNFWAVSTQNQE